MAIESNEEVVGDDTGDGDNKTTAKRKRRQVTRSVDLQKAQTRERGRVRQKMEKERMDGVKRREKD